MSGFNVITRALESREISLAWPIREMWQKKRQRTYVNGEVRKIQSTEEGLDPSCWYWGCRKGPDARKWGWPLQTENDSWPNASQETGTSFYNHEELTSVNNLNEPENGFSPKYPEKNQVQPTHWFLPWPFFAEKLALPDCTRTFDIQNSKIIYLYCFTPLSLW